MPIAVYFGLLTAFITYSVCLPLGVLKALKHRTFIDSASSVLIFLGYSIPGFALGAILLVHLGARMNLFPLFGLTSADFDQLDTVGKIKDLAHHTVLPLICYIVGSFAMLTMMTKNNLMDNLAADYVRTAVAKGASFRQAVFGHAFRNSMIPIATGLGNLVTVFIGGSMLIETVFDIQGFGLLQYQSVIARDVPVIMGTLTIAAFLMLIGHVISDFIVAMVDPRIKFE
jgi:microcin C transport system permease protein